MNLNTKNYFLRKTIKSKKYFESGLRGLIPESLCWGQHFLKSSYVILERSLWPTQLLNVLY